jgi:transposase InsO family protein
MTTAEKVVKNKMGLINLAEHLGNVSEACKIMGFSRDSYYRFKELYDEQGPEGLRELSRSKPNPKNRVDPLVEDAVVKIATDNPALGQLRVSNTLKQEGIFVSPGGVRSIWLRHGLETFKKRLKALEEKAAAENLVLTESQLQAMEKAKEEREAHGEIETEHPGYLGSQDTYYVGTIKGIGRIYQQTFIDTYCKVGFAKLYTSKHAITAADLLNDRVIPWFEAQEVDLLRILTDRGTEYNGRLENHEYQLYLAIENIDHSRTKTRHPQTNGICERFHRTIKEEFYDIAFRKKIYTSLEDLQADLDTWIRFYNEERPHSGKYCHGRTPMQTFSDTRHLSKEKELDTLFSQEVILQQDSNSYFISA